MDLFLDFEALVADYATASRLVLAGLALIIIAGGALGVVERILIAARARGRPHLVVHVRPASSTLFGGRWRPLLWRRAAAVHDGQDLLIYRLYSLTRPCLRVAWSRLSCAGHEGTACALHARSTQRLGPLKHLGRSTWDWTECRTFGTRWDWHRDHAVATCDSDGGRVELRVDDLPVYHAWGGVSPRHPHLAPTLARGGR